MANITRRNTGEQTLAPREWNPFRMMDDLMQWDPFRAMSPLVARRERPYSGGESAFMPGFEVKEM